MEQVESKIKKKLFESLLQKFFHVSRKIKNMNYLILCNAGTTPDLSSRMKHEVSFSSNLKIKRKVLRNFEGRQPLGH